MPWGVCTTFNIEKSIGGGKYDLYTISSNDLPNVEEALRGSIGAEEIELKEIMELVVGEGLKGNKI